MILITECREKIDLFVYGTVSSPPPKGVVHKNKTLHNNNAQSRMRECEQTT